MGVRERKQREKELLRQSIMDAAGQLFVLEGYENVSIRKIADKIEYSPATIYLYFKDKSELLASICMETFAVLTQRLLEAEQTPIDSALAGLKRGLRIYIDFGLEYPNHYLLVFNSNSKPVVPEAEEVNQGGLEAFSCLIRGLAKCMENGDIPAADIHLVSQSVWCMIHGITALLITSHGGHGFPWVEKEAIIDSSLNLILNGLKAGSFPPVR